MNNPTSEALQAACQFVSAAWPLSPNQVLRLFNEVTAALQHTLPDAAVQVAIRAWFEDTRPETVNVSPLPEQARRMRLALAAAIPFIQGVDCTDDLPFRHDDIKRGLILFRTSNNAHGYTNFVSLTAKVDALPQIAKDELACLMRNIASGLSPATQGVK